MHPRAEIYAEDEDKGDVEERPEILGVHCPAVFGDGGDLVQVPAHGINDKHQFECRELCMERPFRAGLVDHGQDVQYQKDDELHHFDDVPGPRHNETVLIENGRPPRIVQRDATILVVIR